MNADINEYLDLAKKINHIDTDYKLAKLLNIERQDVSFLRRKDRKINVIAAVKLAKLTGCHPIEIIAASHYELDKKKNREFWENTYNEYSTIKKIINIFNSGNVNSIITGNNNTNNIHIKE